MSGPFSRRLLLAAAVLLQLVAWHAVQPASIVTLYQLADCSDDGGGVDAGVESAYSGQFDPDTTTYQSMNLTGRTCLPLPIGSRASGLNGTTLYDCQYDPYSDLSTIIVLNWGLNYGPVNPTCNTSRAFLKQFNTPLGSYIQHSGFVNGQCTMLHEGTYGFRNFDGFDLPVYARINCSLMIPNYEVVRQVPSLPISRVLLRGMSQLRPPSSSTSTSSSSSSPSTPSSTSTSLPSASSSSPFSSTSTSAQMTSSSAASSTTATSVSSVASLQSSAAAATSSAFATSSPQVASAHSANAAAPLSAAHWCTTVAALLLAASAAIVA